jgi:hypothetical protein
MPRNHHDDVDHPKHYNTGSIEVIDFVEDQKLGFHLGNAVKYICRAAHKGTPEADLKKAAWYLQRAIDMRLLVDTHTGEAKKTA